jgi:signal transduction histidine kinase
MTYELAREDYRIEHVSESCRPLLGVTPDDLLATGLFPSLTRPQDFDRLLTALKLAAHGRRRFEYEFALQEPTRRFAWVRIVADAYPVGVDEVQYSGVIVDATSPRVAYERLSEVVRADRKQLRASADELRASRARVKRLEEEVSEVSHREQERIGNDLHDGIGQELIGLSMLFKTLEDELRIVPGDYASRVEDIRAILDQCATTTRTLAQSMSPVHLESDGLSAGLSQLALSFQALYDLNIKLTCADNLPAMDATSAANVYRIVQEALSNAVRHARASRVAVRVETRPDTLHLEIEDDGIGLGELDSEGAGMGLKIMRYRAGMLGARIEFTDAPTGGTVVRCTIKTGDKRIAGVET